MSRPRLKQQKINLRRAAQMCAAGCELYWKGNLQDAEKLFRITLSIAPNLYEGWQNLGSSLVEQGRHADGMLCHRRAIAINPNRPASHYGMGVSHYISRHINESIQCSKLALKADPNYTDAMLLLGHSLIVAGDYIQGWFQHERSRINSYNPDYPLWSGEDLAGKRILLLCEQGFGDDLHFIRYAQMVKSLGGYVIVGCKPPLVRLFSRIRWIDEVVPFDSLPPNFDYYCPFMRLPYIFGTTLESIPANIPYLVSEQRATNAGKLKVGLCWAGGRREHDPKANRIDKRRSMRLSHFDPLLNLGGMDWFSLQKGEGRDQSDSRLIDLTESFKDFADTADFVETLDLVITVDTAIAHLAGALGKQVWMLSRFDGCWRWGLEGEKTPWYPTMTIFRQEKPGDWSGVIDNVATALKERIIRC
jgi:hypothetical protein